MLAIAPRIEIRRDDRIDQELRAQRWSLARLPVDRGARREMGAGAVAGDGDPVRVDVELARMRECPFDRDSRVLVRRRIRMLGRAPIVDADDDGLRIARQRGAGAVMRPDAAGNPSAPVKVDDASTRRGSRPIDADWNRSTRGRDATVVALARRARNTRRVRGRSASVRGPATIAVSRNAAKPAGATRRRLSSE